MKQQACLLLLLRVEVREEVPNPAQKAHTRVCGNLSDLFRSPQDPLPQATRGMAIIRGVTVWMSAKPLTENILLLRPRGHHPYGLTP